MTVLNYRYRTNHFIEWCEEEDIDNLNDLSGRDIQQYRLWRKDDGSLNKLTLRMQMSTLRVFLKWAGTIEAVPEDLYDKVMIPRVRPEERQRDETLDAEAAQEILDYLSKYEYGSLEHLLLSLLGRLECGAEPRTLWIRETSTSKRDAKARSSDDEGTTLKNGKAGERLVAMTPALKEFLEDHIADKRLEVTDEYGRELLLTTNHGPTHGNTIRRTIYRITSPCFRGDP